MEKEKLVHLLHIFIIGTLFFYIGTQRDHIPVWLYSVLFYLGIFIVIYHLYKTYVKMTKKLNPWSNVFHILLVGPLLIYIGTYKEKTPRYIFEFILMLSFAVVGYHLYYLIV